MRDVSSEFLVRSKDKVAYPIMRFTVAGADYSDYVLSWPSFERQWNDIRAREFSVSLSNAEGTFNRFRTNPLLLTSSATMGIGFGDLSTLTTESGDTLLSENGIDLQGFSYFEEITLFSGFVGGISYSETRASLTLTDKFSTLGRKLIGTDETPVDYTGSSHLVSDMAWYICTSHGGLSSISSTSNPDIDYASFLEWAAVMSNNNVNVQAYFDGTNCNAALRLVGEATESSIYDENGKLTFKRFNIGATITNSYDDSTIISLASEFDLDNLINRQYVSGGYNVSSGEFGVTVVAINTDTVNSFGAFEQTTKDTTLWLVDTPACLDLAQRVIYAYGEPYEDVQMETTLYGISNHIGDVVGVVNTPTGLSDTFRVMGYSVEMSTGKIELSINQTQYDKAFTLNSSVLDGPDVLA